MTLEDCYGISFPVGGYTAVLAPMSNTLTIYAYVNDKAKIFYEGELPNDFAPQNAMKFVQRLIDLKAFL